MDYSKNFIETVRGRKNPIFSRDPEELYDFKAFGIKLPHPPPNPTKVPKDVMWWKRTRGGVSASMDTQPGDPTALVLRILRSGRR
jgi:hypothetical protein